jgi:hypothetical protein
MLDAHRPAGRLFLLALHDLFNPAASLPPQDRAQELHLYHEANLLVDTLSSNVAVFNLAGAIYLDGTPDPLPPAAGARVLLLPLRQLMAWRSVQPASTDIYAIENPQVFEEVITGITARTSGGLVNRAPTTIDAPTTAGIPTAVGAPTTIGAPTTAGIPTAVGAPTLVCTAGWPSMAALVLLDMLLNASPVHHLHYSGDFDLKGLQIAAHLLNRYADRCSLWHLDPASYALALQTEGVPAQESELAQLGSLPSIFAPLVTTLQAQKKWAYQEGIAHSLIRSLL